MGTEGDRTCPQCGEPVPEAAANVVGQPDAREQRATCPECHVELVRSLDLRGDSWNVEMPEPPPDEELGCGD
jgi:hypothetical protein